MPMYFITELAKAQQLGAIKASSAVLRQKIDKIEVQN